MTIIQYFKTSLLLGVLVIHSVIFAAEQRIDGKPQASDNNGFDAQNFYSLQPDFRRCVAPLCGGAFVNKINRKYTRCADDRWRRRCYVAEVNWQRLESGSLPDYSSDTSLLVQGNIKAKRFDGFGNLGKFVVKSLYGAATNLKDGKYFVSLTDRGVQCVTTPCFSTDLIVLNRNIKALVSSFDLNGVGAGADQLSEALSLIASGEGLIASGHYQRVDEINGPGVHFIAKQFYLPLHQPNLACPAGYKFEGETYVTPKRLNEEADILAIESTQEFTASDVNYEQVVADLTTIRSDFSSDPLVEMRASPSVSFSTLIIGFDDETIEVYRAGGYSDWLPLNECFGVDDINEVGFNYVSLHFQRRYYMPTMQEIYTQQSLPGVKSVSTDSFSGSSSEDVCLENVEDDSRVYIFAKGEGDCPSGCTAYSYSGYMVHSDGKVKHLGDYSTQTDELEPDWFSRRQTCRAYL